MTEELKGSMMEDSHILLSKTCGRCNPYRWHRRKPAVTHAERSEEVRRTILEVR